MGGTSYSVSNRSMRSTSLNYASASMDTLFRQNVEKRTHNSMDPSGVRVREARDSEVNPLSFPIILGLDVTLSMGRIPHYLIKEGLPLIVDSVIKAGVPNPAILFVAIGDHYGDTAPLQVAQFESGDEELDMWLQRTYIEGGGQGNGGESYFLAHYFASRHCQTDHWDKRDGKGVLITIGDEPNHKGCEDRAIREIMGNNEARGFMSDEIVKEAQERWDVNHIIPGEETYFGTLGEWEDLLGQDKAFRVESQEQVAQKIINIIVKAYKGTDVTQEQSTEPTSEGAQDSNEVEIIL